MKTLRESNTKRRWKKSNVIEFPLQDSLKIGEDGVAFKIKEATSLRTMEGDLSRAHRHSFFEILYVEESDGRHTIDHNVYDDIKDKVFLICPGQVHCWEYVTNINAVQIHFKEDFLINTTFSVNAVWELNLLREMGGRCVTIRESDKRQIMEIIKLIYKEYRQKNHEYTSVLRSYINIFLILLFRMYQMDQEELVGHWPQPKRTLLLEDFQKLVIKHVGERRSVKFYADNLGISMGYLNDQVKSHLGVTPSIFIKKAAVTEAKRLIANTNMSMEEIAVSLGFTSGSYFCRMFKTEMGITPTKFKKSCLRQAKKA